MVASLTLGQSYDCPSVSEATMKDIKNNAWVAVNNNFWVMSEAICQ